MADKYDELQCLAYIEGDLTPEERADFERTLADEQNLRKLIDDLIEHKRLLQEMPKEQIPEDVSHGIADQLARRMLLENDDTEPYPIESTPKHQPRMRIGKLAIAATVFIATSATIAVYMANQQPPQKVERGMVALKSKDGKGAEANHADDMDLFSSQIALAEKKADKQGLIRTQSLKDKVGPVARKEATGRLRASEATPKREQKLQTALAKSDTPEQPDVTLGQANPIGTDQSEPDTAEIASESTLAINQAPSSVSAPIQSKLAAEAQSPTDEISAPATADHEEVEDESILALVTPGEQSHADKSKNIIKKEVDRLLPSKPVASTFADARSDYQGAYRQNNELLKQSSTKALTVDLVAEDIEKGQARLLAIADRYGAKVSKMTDDLEVRFEGGRSAQERDAGGIVSDTREVRLTIEEARLPDLLDEISSVYKSKDVIEQPGRKTIAGKRRSYDQSAEGMKAPIIQDMPTDIFESLWGNTYSLLSPKLAVGLASSIENPRPPLLPSDVDEMPAGELLQSNERTVIVQIKTKAPVTDNKVNP